ncbi:plexin-A2-like [Asterias rubens]|uniref:plexin-A2-like n=1 Tax=Asterias rubens TaxID=7604 RepID=UPI001455D5CA|nr:plexin-A2-like [Asterias rubens]
MLARQYCNTALILTVVCLSKRRALISIMFKSLMFMLFAFQIVNVQTTNGSLGYNQFEATIETSFQRMVIDSPSGSLLVASINRLYKLSSDLQVEFEKITGPVADNQACPPPPRSCSVAKTPTNNFNKVLVVDDERHQLIVCGSVYQGTCQILRLEDLNLVERPSREVVTNTEHGTNVAFIAPGTSSGSGSVLYTAASRGMWLRNVPSVAKRVLRRSLYGVVFVHIPGNTIDETAAGNTFDINYINGFSRGHFSFFIATQLENFREVGSPLYTKIVRLCNDDVVALGLTLNFLLYARTQME